MVAVPERNEDEQAALSVMLVQKRRVLLVMGISTAAYLGWSDVLTLMLPRQLIADGETQPLKSAAVFTVAICLVIAVCTWLYHQTVRKAEAHLKNTDLLVQQQWASKSLDLLANNAIYNVVFRWHVAINIVLLGSANLPLSALVLLVHTVVVMGSAITLFRVDVALKQHAKGAGAVRNLRHLVHKMRRMVASAAGYILGLAWSESLQRSDDVLISRTVEKLATLKLSPHLLQEILQGTLAMACMRLVLNSVMFVVLGLAWHRMGKPPQAKEARAALPSEGDGTQKVQRKVTAVLEDIFEKNGQSLHVVEEVLANAMSIAWAISLNGVIKRAAAILLSIFLGHQATWLVATPDSTVGIAVDAGDARVDRKELFSVLLYVAIVVTTNAFVAAVLEMQMQRRAEDVRGGRSSMTAREMVLIGEVLQYISTGLGMTVGKAVFAACSTLSVSIAVTLKLNPLATVVPYALLMTGAMVVGSLRLHASYGKAADTLLKSA
eukprot:TRINITY_DN11048_c0_g4_i1.p1 TRINITY_DN11048_c0_g4~~TRINITY_DN11048_c0_g4_i1.p1  ORF type:complete len:521 (-),score=132.99 TRINITY_DN11048_c0_g4_i1:320-1798(-)